MWLSRDPGRSTGAVAGLPGASSASQAFQGSPIWALGPPPSIAWRVCSAQLPDGPAALCLPVHLIVLGPEWYSVLHTWLMGDRQCDCQLPGCRHQASDNTACGHSVFPSSQAALLTPTPDDSFSLFALGSFGTLSLHRV